jgi:hypothetical protein
VSLPTVGEPFYVTLVRLDATPLERPVVVLATSYGVGSGGCGDEVDPPKLERIALQ